MNIFPFRRLYLTFLQGYRSESCIKNVDDVDFDVDDVATNLKKIKIVLLKQQMERKFRIKFIKI